MYNNKKISLIFPSFNEEECISKAIEEFDKTNIIDEIIAVDNNSTDKTAEIIKRSKATYVLETTQGYGAAIRRGLKECSGDLLVVTEPDGSFTAKDLDRLLSYTDKYDCVFGTRTSKDHIEKGAKMNFLLRSGNIIVAKFLSILFPFNNFTDVGCTYKILSRKSYDKIKDDLKVIGSELQPEIMVRTILKKQSIKEIPVVYKERSGRSKITKDFTSTAILALKMIKLIIMLRIKSIF